MPDVRKECYNRLIDFMYAELQKYYTENPELCGDPRSIAGVAASRDGMQGMLKILDEYEITRKVETTSGTQGHEDKSH